LNKLIRLIQKALLYPGSESLKVEAAKPPGTIPDHTQTKIQDHRFF